MDNQEGAAERPTGLTRRRFLASVGIGLVGAATIGAAFFGSAQNADGAIPTDQWLFGRYVQGCTDVEFDDTALSKVTLPHCATPLSWTGWQPATWENLWVYRQYFDTTPGLRRGRAFVRFDGVLSAASVYLNGRLLGTHLGGYLPFEFELTKELDPQSNVLAVVVDGRWNQNVPPDLVRFTKPSAIDFYQPAGIYRGAAVTVSPKARVVDVFACPLDVLTADRRMDLTATVNSAGLTHGPVRLQATLFQNGQQVASEWTELDQLNSGDNTMALTMTGLDPVGLWDIDDPRLCDVQVTLWINNRQADQTSVRVGFRDARFTQTGFFLNGRRVKLFGLNRHQWYPYVGGAMPDRVQRADAELLKNQLNCNMVRCSHYPQSPAFLDACDELGLMVWEEIPGWDYVGDEVWQQRVIDDVRGMVTRDRNHPSIIVWGTRINETLGQTELYNQTDALAMRLDGSRPTTGAVKGALGYAEALYAGDGSGAPAVFAFNDYSRPQPPELAPLRPPRPEVAYLVSEAVGTLVGPPSFKRTDPLAIQQEQAVLHAAVHNQAAGDDRYCGLLGWCAFDYPSGWYHSVDGVKYPGVADIFRIPKLGAAFYRAQADPSRQLVIEPAFYWDFGPKSPRNGPGPRALIWSNCERVDVYLDNVKHASVTPDRTEFAHLDHPPFIVNLALEPNHRPELRLDGFLGGTLALSRKFSPDPRFDTLSCAADDAVLTADGSDTTRVVVRVLDRYGAPRPYVEGAVRLSVSGPGTLIGDNPLELGKAGGAAAVWLRTLRASSATITITATHPTAGSATARVVAR